MLEKGSISKQQMMFLVTSSLLGTSILFLPQVLALHAKQDCWLTAILGGLAGLLLFLLWVALATRFPRRNLVEYARKTLGPWLGTLVVIPYAGYLLWLLMTMLRQVSSFFALVYPETPLVVIAFLIILVAMYIVHHGLEVLARVNDLLSPILFLGILVMILLALPKFTIQAFQPVLADGLGPVLSPLKLHVDFPYGNAAAFLMIFPYINRPQELRSAVVKGSLFGSALIVILLAFSLFTLGPESMIRTVYPTYAAARTIVIAGILARIDGLVIILWILSNVIRIAIFFYAAVLCLSELFGLSSYQYLIIPLGHLITIGSIIVYTSAVDGDAFNAKWFPWATIPVILVVPLLLLIISSIRSKRQQRART
ncbi:MAG TPA: endospore germination permease [Firmicutes bacterium]|nr:endospore germination permease [Bacillota bacterium]